MLSFSYEARDSRTGELVRAEVDADSEQAAAKLIKQEGLSPLTITMKSTARGNILNKYANRIKAKDRILFARQLSTLINAGLPLVQSLRSVLEQTASKPLKVVITKVIADVESGSTFAGALSKHPKVFNQIFTSLIAAGETSGTLDKALERIAMQQEKDDEIMKKVRGAMMYPLIVLFVMVLVVGFMVIKVLPQVEGIYKGLPNVSLPVITRALLSISHFATKFWWIAILLLAGAGYATSKWARTGPGKEVVDRLKMRAWPIGPLFMKLYMARFARTGATLVASGVPLLQVMEVTSKAVSNVHVEQALMRAAEKVKGGKALSAAIQNDKNFLPLVPSMLKIGEQSGQIEQMLGKVAEYYEKEVDNEVKSISTIIEPVMMVMLGVVAFIIVAAILLPIYGLAGQSGLAGR